MNKLEEIKQHIVGMEKTLKEVTNMNFRWEKDNARDKLESIDFRLGLAKLAIDNYLKTHPEKPQKAL